MTLLTCLAIVVFWAAIRPNMVRDSDDGRRLDQSLTGRLTFVILAIIVFLALSVVFDSVAMLLKELSQATGGVATHLFQRFEGQEPIFALFAISGFYSLRSFQYVERHLLAWLHGAPLDRKFRTLSDYLQDCAFVPSSQELEDNIRQLEFVEAYGETNELVSIVPWRKTASLLRYVREWDDAFRTLSNKERDTLYELEKAHGRRTRLAMDIVHTLNSLRAGNDSSSAVAEILERASRSDGRKDDTQVSQERTEAYLPTDRPVRMSSAELQQYFAKVESFFQVEYRSLLEQASVLGAKSILRTGNNGVDRMEQLKTAGFQGLGTIRRLNVEYLVWLVTLILGFGIALHYVPWLDQNHFSNVQNTFLLGTGIALASLVGAFFGSGGGRPRRMSWGTYFLAGFAAIVGFLALELAREAASLSLIPESAKAVARGTDLLTQFTSFAPWTIIPFVTAAGVCWLATSKTWFFVLDFGLSERRRTMIQPMVDGVFMGLLVVAGFVVAIATIQFFDLPPTPSLASGLDPIFAQKVFALSGALGAVVVPEVRQAANAQLVRRTQTVPSIGRPLSDMVIDWLFRTVPVGAGAGGPVIEPVPGEVRDAQPMARTNAGLAERGPARPSSGSRAAVAYAQRSETSSRGTADARGEDVHCSVFAPRRTSIDTTIRIQAFLHLPEQESEVSRLAARIPEASSFASTSALTKAIAPGSRIGIILECDQMVVPEPSRVIRWTGRPVATHFVVVPPNGSVGTDLTFRIRVMQGRHPIGVAPFAVGVTVAGGRHETGGVPSRMRRHQKAFVSYSSEDRAVVIEHLKTSPLYARDIFLDVLTLEPGERWKQGLYRHIDDAELFLLFWSRNSRASKWVILEAEYALELQRKRQQPVPDIFPVILEGPPPPKPPKSLRAIHFNSAMQYLLAAELLGQSLQQKT